MTPVRTPDPGPWLVSVAVRLPEPFEINAVADAAHEGLVDHLAAWTGPVWMGVGRPPDSVSTDGRTAQLGWSTQTADEAQALGLLAIEAARMHGYPVTGSTVREAPPVDREAA